MLTAVTGTLVSLETDRMANTSQGDTHSLSSEVTVIDIWFGLLSKETLPCPSTSSTSLYTGQAEARVKGPYRPRVLPISLQVAKTQQWGG